MFVFDIIIKYCYIAEVYIAGVSFIHPYADQPTFSLLFINFQWKQIGAVTLHYVIQISYRNMGHIWIGLSLDL